MSRPARHTEPSLAESLFPKRARVLAALGAIALVLMLAIRAFVSREPETGGSKSEAHESAAPNDRASSGAFTVTVDGPASTLHGVVTDEAREPLALSHVCAFDAGDRTVGRSARCTDVRVDGRYDLELTAGRWTVSASAPSHRPRTYRDDKGEAFLALDAGESRSAIDFTLAAGGASLSGRVRNALDGKPIAQAHVQLDGRFGVVVVETDETGVFSAWAEEGDVSVSVEAHGYAPDTSLWTTARTIDVALVPGAVLTGRVVDAATQTPIEGALVRAAADADGAGSWTTAMVRTDAEGRFRIEDLPAGHYKPWAESLGLYGDAALMAVVSVGETTPEVVIPMHHAFHVAAQMTVDGSGAPCADGHLELFSDALLQWNDGHTDRQGVVVLTSVLPGEYVVTAECGQRIVDGPKTLVVDRDLSGVVFHVRDGLTLRGVVVDADGKPVPAATVVALSSDSSADRPPRSAVTLDDGSFVMVGLVTGTFELRVQAENAPPLDGPGRIEVTEAPSSPLRLVLEPSGRVHGHVVDEHGVAVVGATVESMNGGERAVTRSDGSFDLAGVRLDTTTLRVRSSDGDELPPVDGKDPPTVKVVARTVTSVEILVHRPMGVVFGRVVDAQGKPAAAAMVEAMPGRGGALAEIRSAAGMGKRAIADAEGRFRIEGLGEGPFDLYARRTGLGDGAVANAPLGVAATIALQPTSSLVGTVGNGGGGGAPVIFDVTVRDDHGFYRSEQFFHTDGRFTIGDLPAGRYTVQVGAPDGDGSGEATVANGAPATVTISLDLYASLTGVVVDALGKPVPRARVLAYGADDLETFADENGKFTLARVHPGHVELEAWGANGDGVCNRKLDVSSGRVDVGALQLGPETHVGETESPERPERLELEVHEGG